MEPLIRANKITQVGLISFDGYFGYLLVLFAVEHTHIHLTQLKEICHIAAALGT